MLRKAPQCSLGASEFSLRETEGQWQAVRALSFRISAEITVIQEELMKTNTRVANMGGGQAAHIYVFQT